MAVTLNYTFGAEAEIALADQYPFIRLFSKCPRKYAAAVLSCSKLSVPFRAQQLSDSLISGTPPKGNQLHHQAATYQGSPPLITRPARNP